VTPWTRYVSPAVGALIVLTVVMSFVTALDTQAGGRLWLDLALVPEDVLRGQLWRLVTWPLVERAPITLLLACFSLHWLAGDLAAGWGQRSLVQFVVTTVLAAGVGTTLIALALGVGQYVYLGGWPLRWALAIAWGLQFPERSVLVYRLIPIGARWFAFGLVAMVGICAVFLGVEWVLPVMIAAAVALVRMREAI
jgi:membrane associated rhomboid family serine protease